MKRRSRRRIQKPLSGGRDPIWGALDPALRRWVERQAARDHCSLPLVVNSTISFASGIPLEGDEPVSKPAKVLRMRLG